MTGLTHATPCGCSDWRNHCGSLGCLCTTPDPDPASPCGYLTFGEDRCTVVPFGSVPHEERSIGSHPHVPTLCRCGHGLKEEPR